jgi:hypothetical protein
VRLRQEILQKFTTVSGAIVQFVMIHVWHNDSAYYRCGQRVIGRLKILPVYYGTGKFITLLTRVRPSWARWIHSIPPNPISLWPILILFPQLCLGLPSGSFPSCSPTKTLYVLVFSHISATCPANLIIFDLIILIIFDEEYELLRFSLNGFL